MQNLIKTLFFIFILSCQSLTPKNNFVKTYEGTIGTSPVIVKLKCDNNAISGAYYYANVGTEIPLSGAIDSKSITLNELDNKGNIQAVFNADFTNSQNIKGTWKRSNAKKNVSFSLIETSFIYSPIEVKKEKDTDPVERVNPEGISIPIGENAGIGNLFRKDKIRETNAPKKSNIEGSYYLYKYINNEKVRLNITLTISQCNGDIFNFNFLYATQSKVDEAEGTAVLENNSYASYSGRGCKQLQFYFLGDGVKVVEVGCNLEHIGMRQRVNGTYQKE